MQSPLCDRCNRCSPDPMLCSGTIAHVRCLDHVQISGAWATLVGIVAAPLLL